MSVMEGFLSDIRENPGDDVPRLIFADWLQDQGDTHLEDWARLIRSMIAYDGLSRRGCLSPRRNGGWCEWAGEPLKKGRLCDHCKSVATLQAVLSNWQQNKTLACPCLCYNYGNVKGSDHNHATWDRGFVAEVGCSKIATWRECAALIRMHPVLKVEVNDRRPFRPPQRSSVFYCWLAPAWHDEGDVLPDEVFEALEGGFCENGELPLDWRQYGSEEEARVALSRALIKVARR